MNDTALIIPPCLEIEPGVSVMALLDAATSYEITSPEIRDAADADLLLIKKSIKAGEATKKQTLAPLKAALEAEAAIFDGPLKRLATAKDLLTGKIMEWDRAQKRLAAERQAEAEKAAEAARVLLEKAGMADAAKLVAAAPSVPVKSEAASSGTREHWRAEVEDFFMLLAAILDGSAPQDCVVVNASYLNAQAREKKADLRIPGVVAVREELLVAKRERKASDDNF